MTINNEHPFISIIIPVYKTELYIEKTIQSIVNQSFNDFDVILVNDETPDNAINLAENILQKNSINYKTLFQKNSGLGISKNNGAKHAKGKWLTFIDSDDVLQPDTLQKMQEVILKNPEVNFIYSGFQKVSIENEFKASEIDNDDVVFYDKFQLQNNYLYRSEIILSPGTLYNTEWYRNNGLSFKKIPYSMDQLFVWEMLLKAEKAAKIQKTLYNYLQRPGSIMSSSKFSAITKGYPEFQKLQQQYIESDQATKLAKKYLLSRWIIGILHSGAKLLTKKEYQELCKTTEAKKHSIKMLGFPSMKMRIVALAIFISPNISYWVFKKV